VPASEEEKGKRKKKERKVGDQPPKKKKRRRQIPFFPFSLRLDKKRQKRLVRTWQAVLGQKDAGAGSLLDLADVRAALANDPPDMLIRHAHNHRKP
jgi:hypothetical protein